MVTIRLAMPPVASTQPLESCQSRLCECAKTSKVAPKVIDSTSIPYKFNQLTFQRSRSR